MSHTHTDEISSGAGWSLRVVFVTAVSFLIVPAVSYTFVCLNAPSEIIRQFMNQTEVERTGQPLSQSKIDSLYGLLVAVTGLGSVVGSLVTTSLSDRIGRKHALYVTNLTACLGFALMVLCSACRSYEMLFVGRAVSGVAAGWAMTIAPTYNMEMCLPDQKGAVAMVFNIIQSVGIVTAQVCGYEELLGNSERWLYLIGLPLVLLALQLVLLPFCPQNPRFLLMNRNDEAGAIKAMQFMRGQEDVSDDIKQIRQEMADSADQTQLSIWDLIRMPTLRRLLLVTIVMGMHLSMSGLSAVSHFSATLFNNVGVSDRNSRYATSGTGTVFLLGNLVAAFLLPHFGRKTIFLTGTGAMSVFTATFAITVIFQEKLEFLKYVGIAVTLLIVAAFSLGPMAVIWVILGEMSPHNVRGAAFGLSILSVYLAFFLHGYTLPIMMETMSSYTFFVFAGINAGMVVFGILFLPETRNKTFEQILESWKKKKDTENQPQSLNTISLTISQSNIQTEKQQNGVYQET